MGNQLFLDIICGLLPPEQGKILINEIEATEIDKKSYYQKLVMFLKFRLY